MAGWQTVRGGGRGNGGNALPLAIFVSAFVLTTATLFAPELGRSASSVAVAILPAAMTDDPGGDTSPPPVTIAPPNEARDMHFSGCRAAHAAGRYSIPAWDPSYRERMDGDSDGFACEPLPREPAARSRPAGRVRVFH